MRFYKYSFKIYLVCILIALISTNAYAYLYTVKSKVNLRSTAGTENNILQKLDQNQTLKLVSKHGEWLQVQTLSGQMGFVHNDMLSDVWIKVHKKERRMYVIKGGEVIKTYPVALCPFNPLGDKIKQGDGGTPEGRFFLCESIKNPQQAKYGARSMRLSYPNIEDARRGLKDKLINYEIYKDIVKAIKSGKMPNQRTKLGSSLRIHGGGSSSDWTLGCIALDDRDIVELYDLVPGKVRVEVYKTIEQDKKINSSRYLNERILDGSYQQLANPALYTDEAAALVRISYPMGDIMEDQAVCTDIIIRALRIAGIDLQALVHEDIMVHPDRYSTELQRSDYQIDHRRTRVLQIYFNHNTQILKKDIVASQNGYLPGDIVTLDTGIRNGTIYDHIGIVDDKQDERGYPKLINIWTTGCRTESMSLLGNDYPTVVGHFHMTHLFDYL